MPFFSDTARITSNIEKYPGAHLIDYEVWFDTKNQELFLQFTNVLGFIPQGVPVTIIGDQYWVGYREDLQPEIEAALQDCSRTEHTLTQLLF